MKPRSFSIKSGVYLTCVYMSFIVLLRGQTPPSTTIFPVLPPLTNEVCVQWSPSPDTNVTGYGIALGTNSGHYLYTNLVGNVTNYCLDDTNPFPWFIVAVSTDTSGDFSIPSNELPWNGLMPYDVTNYFYVKATNQAVSITVIAQTNNPPTGNQFFRNASMLLVVTGQVSPDLVNWYPTNWTVSQSNASFSVSDFTTELWTNAPIPTNYDQGPQVRIQTQAKPISSPGPLLERVP